MKSDFQIVVWKWLMILIILSHPFLFAADDITPPATTTKLIFIHHSTGGNWLADPTDDYPSGGLAIALKNNNYFVSATNYGWGPDGIGDRTDIPNWPEWFTGPNHAAIMTAVYSENDKNVGDFGEWSRLASNPGGKNEIVMFKSCFPNSDIYGEPTDAAYDEPNDWEYSVANAKAVYNKILTYFATRQDKLFILITAPPQWQSEYLPGDQTPAKRAANARALNNWLVNDWLTGYAFNNVAVFDYYNVLTSNGGTVDTNDLNKETGNHHRWWNGAIQHIQTVNNNFASYPSGDSHPSSAGHRKATAEFLPLLNVFYHRWKSGTGVESTPVPVSHTLFHRAFPNPFNSEVILSITSSQAPDAVIIYDVLGRQIRHLNRVMAVSEGEYRLNWDGLNDSGQTASSGIYFYAITIDHQQSIGKILLTR
jgi:hypothetical protein